MCLRITICEGRFINRSVTLDRIIAKLTEDLVVPCSTGNNIIAEVVRVRGVSVIEENDVTRD